MPDEPQRALRILPDARTRLAAERTLLAWVRTGLAMMGFGFVVARFGIFIREFAGIEKHRQADPAGLSLWFGGALLLLGVGINIAAALEYRQFLKRYERGEDDRIPRWSLGITSAILLAVVGVAMGAYLLVLHV